MLLLVVVLCGVLTVPLTGGRLLQLGNARLRASYALVAALAIQIVIVSVLPNANPTALRVLHVVSYALAALFLFANRQLRGIAIVAAGAALNVVAILANGGVMPASTSALRTAEAATDARDFVNSGVVAHPRLLFLGDVFSTPHSLPLQNVFSVGDVLIAIGAVVVIHTLCRRQQKPAN